MRSNYSGGTPQPLSNFLTSENYGNKNYLKYFSAALKFFLSIFMLSSFSAQSQCTYTLELSDSWGDGWNGNQIEVTVDTNVSVYTLTDPPGNFQTYPISVNTGDSVIINYLGGGSFNNEVSFELRDPLGVIVYSSGLAPATGVAYNAQASCPPCLTGTMDSVNNITTSSAELFFTTNLGTLVNFEYGQAGFALGNGLQVLNVPDSAGSYNFTGLYPGFDYHFYMQDSCIGNGVASWVGPFVVSIPISAGSSATTGTFSSGDIATDYNTGPAFGTSFAACMDTLSLSITPGNVISSVDISYDMTAGAGAYMSEQRTYVFEANSSNSESQFFSGVGFTGGTYSYNRTGVNAFNGLSTTGQLDFVINAFRTWGGLGCDLTYNKVDNNTWTITVNSSPAPSCFSPDNVSISNTINSADVTISDTTNTGASYRIQYGVTGFALGTGATMVVSGPGTYALSNILTDENYTVYVQTICSSTDSSTYFGPYNFNTVIGENCNQAEIISSLPFVSDTVISANFSDDYGNSAPCNWPYMDGNDYVFSYTPTITQRADVNLVGTSSPMGFIITRGCPDTSGVCLAEQGGFTTNDTEFGFLFEAGETYFITLDDDGSADEFILSITPLPQDVSMNSIDNPVNPVSAGFASVDVNISNIGGNPINSVSFGYTKNGVTQAPVTVALNNLNPNDDTTVTIGGTNFPTTPTDIVAYISSVDGVADNNQANDTVSTRFCGAISGTFTVGGAGADFASLGAAVEALDCGINGPIVFNINPGTYNENIVLSEVVGSSATNTITFDGGSAATTIISFNPSSTDQPVIYINGGDYYTLTNLTIENLWTSTDCWGVFLENDAHHNTIDNCVVRMPNSTSSDRACIVASNATSSATSSGNNTSNITITNNTLEGAWYGVALRGTSSASRNPGVVIENNNISANRYGIYTYYMDTMSIKNNVFTTHSNPTTHYGLYLYYADDVVAESNDITSTDVGIQLFTGNSHRYVNNMVKGGSDRGFFLNNVDNVTMLHNSIFGNPGFEHQSGSSEGLTFRNNIFASENDFGFETNGIDSADIVALDYNIYYSVNGSPVEFDLVTYDTLANLQAAATYANVNSIFGDPLFNSNTDLHITLGILADSAGTPVGIITDIDGDGRYFLAPDIGADEYTPITSDLELLSDVSFNICKNGSDSITFYIVNKAQSQIDFSNDNFTLNVNVSGAASSTASINVNSGIVNPSDTFSIVASPIILNVEGSYNIDAYLSSTWDIVNDNDSLFGATYDEVFPISLSPDTVVQIINATQTVDLKASSIFSAPAMFNITERCNWASASTGAAVGGKPSWMTADDYVEISGAPNSDIGGYTYELWTATSIRISYTFPAGTFLSPNGTLILGTYLSGSASPSNFYYVTSTQSSTSSSTANGNILKDPNGNIIDAVGYNSYNFPAASGVTSADWSGNLSGGGSTWGIRLQGPDLNGPTGWSVSSNTNRQDPNVYNTGFPAISQASSYPVSWSLNSTLIDSVMDITVGPFTVADNGLKAYVFELNGPCGAVYDTAYVNVTIIPNEVSVDTILGADGGCNVDTAYFSAIICNNGANGYQNLPVYANLDGFIFSDTLDTLAPYSCDTVMFGTGITILSTDTTFNNLSIYINVTGDVDNTNDTTGVGPIVYTGPPLSPTVLNDTICAGETAMLVAFSTTNIEWYDADSNLVGTDDTLLLSGLTANDTLYAQSGTAVAGSPKFSEISQYTTFAGSGWPTTPSWFSGDDYVEITGPPSMDISGYTLSMYTTSGVSGSVLTIPAGSILSPTGVATISISNGISSPADYFYNAGNNASSSGTTRGYVLKDPNGTIIDAVAYGGFSYTFPAVSGVTSSDWSTGTIPASTGNTAGIRRIGPDNNSSSDWITTGVTSSLLQDPGVYNVGIPPSTTVACFNEIRTMAVVYYNGFSVDSVNSTAQSSCQLIDGTISVFATDTNTSIGSGFQYSIDGGATFSTNSVFTGLAQNANGYDVVVTDGFCTESAGNVAITKPGAPAAPVMPANATYCEGDVLMPLFVDTATYASAATIIRWYNSPTISALNQIGQDTLMPIDTIATITYYATQVDSGCEGAVASVDVTVNPQPNAPVLSSDTSLCFGVALMTSSNVPGFIPTSYFEDFELGTGGWALGSVPSAVWTRRNTQPTSGTGTGPFGGSVNGIPTPGNYFVYMETSGSGSGQISYLTGPGFNFQPNSIVEFDYHMHGSAMGSLALEVFDGSTWTQVWSVSGPQQTSNTAPYNHEVISIANYIGSGNIRFKGTRSNSFTSDMAVDNISVYNSQPNSIWAFDNSFTNIYDTAATITALDSAASITYFVNYTAQNGCESAYDSITVTKLGAPVAPTVASQVYCDGDTITPLPITGSGGTYNVYGDMMLNNQITSGVSSYTTSLTGPGYADYYVTEVNAIGCESPAGMASVTINAVPTSANLGADKNYCQGDSILPLSAGNIPGTTLNWYSDAAGTTLLGTGSYQPANTVGTTTYYASLTNGLCSGPIDSVQVTINAIPSTPTAAGGATYCDGDALAALTATGSSTSFSWYTDAALTNMVGSGASFTPANIIDTVTYYVTQDANGCESAGADSATVIIHGNPTITSVADTAATSCVVANGIIEIFATGGDGTYNYSVNGGTSTQASGKFTGLNIGNYSPYVVDGNGCSDMASVVTINAPGQPLQPSVVAGNNGVYCQGDAYAALEVVDTISGQTFNWYYDAALTSLYMSGDSVMPADSAGTLTYYVTANASGCQSPSATATVTINPIPVAPTGGNDLTYCLGQPVGNVSGSANSGGSLRWYSNNNLTSLIGTGNSVAAGSVAILPGTYSFYVTETTTGCESTYDSVNVTINPIPNIPNAGMDMTYCDGEMLMPLVGTGSGGALNWYSNVQLTNVLAANDTLTLTTLPVGKTDFWLAETNGFGCEGNSDKVSVTVNPTPAAPMIVGADDYCEYETVGTLMAMGNGGVYDWSDANGVVAADTNMYTPSNMVGMYEITATETNSFGCTSEADTAMVNVFQRPAIASTLVINAFGGCADSTGSIEINAIDGDGNYTYYGKIFGSLLNNGSDSVFANLPSGTYDSLLVVDGNGCFSGTDIASISSPTKPAQLALISGGGSYCDGEPLDLVVQDTSVSTNGTIEWYADSSLQNLIFASDTLSPSTAVGNYTYYAVENNFGCKSDPQQVSVVINALPSTPTTSDDTTYCDGETIADITVSGGNGTFTWYSDAALTTVFSQGSSTVTPSITTPGQEALYVTETDGNGCNSAADSVLVVVNPKPNVPSIGLTNNICSNFNVVNSSYFLFSGGLSSRYGVQEAIGNGGQFTWYTDYSSPQVGDSIFPPTTPGNYTLFLTETNSFGCESDSTAPTSLSVLDVPTVDSIVVTNVTGSCTDSVGSFEIFASNGSTGNSLTYEAIVFGNRVFNGSNNTFTNLTVGTYDSVLVKDNNGCYSNFSTISITAPGQPSALEPISNDTLYCFGDQIADLSVVDTSTSTTGTIEWYSNAGLSNQIGTGATITPDSTVGVKTYYALENNNGCKGSAVAIQVNVSALPAAPITSSNVQYCDGDAINDIYATGAGGTITWYSNSSLTNVFAIGDTTTPSISTPGQEVLYAVETDSNGCTSANANNITIGIDTLPNVTTSPLADICENSGTVQLMDGVPMGGTWSADSGFTNGLLDPIAIGGAGTYTVTYTYTDGNGCSASDTESITVNAPPVVSFTGLSNLCLDASSFVLTGGSPVGGVYSGNGVDSNGSFNPLVVGVGSKILTYTYTDSNNCTNTDTDTLSVNSLPNVSIAPLPAICENGGTVNLSGGSPLGGTWSADSGLTSGGILDPLAIGGAGTYGVRYSYTDGNGCTSADTTSLLINPEPVVTFSGLANVCFDQASSTLSGGLPLGGNYSGNGVVGGAFSTATAGVGTHVITYNYTDANSCSSTNTDTIQVYALPNANAGVDQTICFGDSVTLTATGGTSYSWSNGANNDSTSVSPLVDTTYVVTVTDLNNCSLSDTISITIDTLPTVTLAPLADVCENAGVIGLMGGMPMGGTWSADSGVTAGGVIDPVAIGGAGTYNVTYTFTDGNGCTSDDVQSLTINPEPVVTFAAISSLCIDGGTFAVTGGSPAGGMYVGNGVDTLGNFDPTVAGAGTTTLTYNYTDANNCSSSNTSSVTVFALPNAGAGVDQTICFGDSVTLTATGGTSYSWSNGSGNASQSVSPATTTNYGVLVTDVNGCTNTDSVMVNVNQLPTVSIGSINSVCDGAAPVALLTGTPANGTYSGTGVGGGVFNPSVGAGSYVITYSFTDGNNCSNSATTTLVVDTLPTVTFATPANICVGSAATNLTGGLPAGGIYTGTGVTGSQFDPVTAGGAGTYNLSYSFTDGNGCANSVTSTITVDTLPTITWTAFNDICDNAPAITLSEAAPAGGSYSGAGVAGGQFDPAATGGAGNYTITYNYTDGNGCSSSDDQSITVNPSPVVDLGGDTTLCNNIPTVTLDAGSGASYVWSLDGLTLSDTTQTINVDGATGSGTYTVVVTNAFGCEGEDEVVVDFTEICASVNTTFADNVSVTYYPNPTTGMLNVDITGLVGEDITLTVTNMHGQQVFNTFIENAPSNLRDVIDISTEASGVYFIKLTSGDKSFVERISLR